MKRLLLLTFFSLFFTFSYSQYVYKLKADSVHITNDSCNAELNLENKTKDTLGFLYNKGKGRTEFRRAMRKINDSVYLFGNDSLNLSLVFNNLGLSSNTFFKQNGNFFNATANLGTNDNNHLEIKTNNLIRQKIANNGNYFYGDGTAIDTFSNFQVKSKRINFGHTNKTYILSKFFIGVNTDFSVPLAEREYQGLCVAPNEIVTGINPYYNNMINVTTRGNYRALGITRTGNDANGGIIEFLKTRRDSLCGGCSLVPNQIGDEIGKISFGTYAVNTSSVPLYYQAADFGAYLENSPWSPGIKGFGQFRWSTVTPSNNTLSIKMTLTASGSLLMGTSTEDTSAILNLVSTTRGFASPVMTGAQQNAIVNPRNGLLIYNSDSSHHTYYNSITGTWQKIGGGGSSGSIQNIYTANGSLTANRFINLDTSMFSIKKNSATYLHLFNNGNLWLGNGTPVDQTFKLDVQGVLRTTALAQFEGGGIQIKRTGAEPYVNFFRDGVQSAQIRYSNTNGLIFTNGGGNVMYHSFNGFRATIGGTTISEATLNTTGVSGIRSLLLAHRTNFTPDGYFSTFALRNSLDSGYQMIDGFGVGMTFQIADQSQPTIDIGVIGAVRNTADTDGDIFFTTRMGGNLTEKARITRTGALLINTTTDNTSAILNINSSNKGVLIPRLTTTQQNAISSPASGLLVYNTDSAAFSYYNGVIWNNLNGGGTNNTSVSFSLTSNFTSSSTTLSNITGLSYTMQSGASYKVEFRGLYQTDATSTGISLGLSGTGNFLGEYDISSSHTLSTSNSNKAVISSSGSTITSTSVSNANTATACSLQLIVHCTSNSTLNIRFASSAGGSVATMLAGSTLMITRIK
jgi:hypothetical protein